MKRMRGFTLIELLIVVAIIAILAAIAVPNFLEAQTRAKVSRVMSDMRSVGTAIESYSVDYNSAYPCAANNRLEVYSWGSNHGSHKSYPTLQWKNDKWVMQSDYWATGRTVISENWSAWKYPDPDNPSESEYPTLSPGFFRCTFAHPAMGGRKVGLTTPVAYIADLPSDPFTKEPDVNYGYAAIANKGWIMWSTGPDMDFNYNENTGLSGSNSIDLAMLTTTTVTDSGDRELQLVGAPEWNHCPPGKSANGKGDAGKWVFKWMWFCPWQGFSSRVNDNPWVNVKADWEDNGMDIPVDINGDFPSSGLLRMSYDATNGSLSSGDVWKLND